MPSLIKKLAWLYLFTTIIVVSLFVSRISTISSSVDFDIFSMLPRGSHTIYANEALKKMSSKGQDAVVFLIESSSEKQSTDTANELILKLTGYGLAKVDSGGSLEDIKELYFPHRYGLVAKHDLLSLVDDEATWYKKSISIALSVSGQLFSWADDPFGLTSNWLNQLGKGTKFRPKNGLLVYGDDSGKQYALVQMSYAAGALSVTESQKISANIDSCIQDIQLNSAVKIYKSGVVFHTANASKTAQNEAVFLGGITLVSVFILLGIVFSGVKPIASVFLSVFIGALFATFFTHLVFEKIYGFTLIFSVSLIGVAIDYGLIYISSKTHGKLTDKENYKYLYPAMFLAVLVNVAAYSVLLATPFAVFSQMAFFSVIGIFSSALVVFLWFPFFGVFKRSTFSFHGSTLLDGYVPTLRKYKAQIFLVSALSSVVCLSFFRANDDIRVLINLNPQLLREQIEVSKVFDLPSPAHFFVVVKATPEEVLIETESLTKSLDELILEKKIGGYEAITRYLPSVESQKNAYELVAKNLYQNKLLAGQIEDSIDLPKSSFEKLLASKNFIKYENLAQSKSFQPLNFLLFRASDGKFVSIVMMKGISAGNLGFLELLANGQSIFWVNKPNEISMQLAENRFHLEILLVISYILASFMAFIRYRRDFWRIVFAPLLGSMVSLSIFIVFGGVVNILVIASLVLVLGFGADYAIFMNEGKVIKAVKVGLLLAMLTAFISFGLLSFSLVPAVAGFGAVFSLGIIFSWFFSCTFSRDEI